MADVSAPRPVLDRVLATIRTIIGAPDYDRYVAHVHDRHPECTPLTREEFARERLAARYDRPGSRCC
jgi:uncharacterized short protein YbdD (DUF466 family)